MPNLPTNTTPSGPEGGPAPVLLISDLVPSSSDPGKGYRVKIFQGGAATCTCMAYVFGSRREESDRFRCKHIMGLARGMGRLDLLRAEPAPVTTDERVELDAILAKANSPDLIRPPSRAERLGAVPPRTKRPPPSPEPSPVPPTPPEPFPARRGTELEL